ncbi:MAG: hypothetical protein AAF674_07910 [Pseudomonadota bacterium]
MKRFLICLLALILSVPAAAADDAVPIGPGEFREYAEGYTLYFERDGEYFGSESFEAGGEVRWRYRDGSCVSGNWRAHGAQICFLYESEAQDDVLCWRMLRDEEGLLARLLNGDNPGLELRIVGRDREPLLCGDPGTQT